jgi:ABC-2 type transport system ATP-binding protein
LISVENLTVSFNGFVAVNGINFEVNQGEVLGILGANGAGKSTTMKSLAGIIRPQGGFIRIENHTLTNIREEEAAKTLLGYCPDVGGLVVGATPREHIQLLLSLHKRPEDYDLGLYLVDKIGLKDVLDTPVGGFSHGMSRRLSVVLATLASTKVLILDEPFDGVDPVGVDAIEAIVKEAKASGLSVVISTHLQNLLTGVADRVIIMRKGDILAEMPAKTLQGKRGETKYKNILENADRAEEKQRIQMETADTATNQDENLEKTETEEGISK